MSAELVPGQIVTSRQGRDVTRVYMVAKVEGERILLVDGGKRTLAAPKAKNIRHIQPTNERVPEGERTTDIQIKSALKAYQDSRQAQQQGG